MELTRTNCLKSLIGVSLCKYKLIAWNTKPAAAGKNYTICISLLSVNCKRVAKRLAQTIKSAPQTMQLKGGCTRCNRKISLRCSDGGWDGPSGYWRRDAFSVCILYMCVCLYFSTYCTFTAGSCPGSQIQYLSNKMREHRAIQSVRESLTRVQSNYI